VPAGAASFERIARFEPELRDAPLVEKGYRCISVTTTAAFEALEPRWRALLSHSATPSPFFSWEFAVEWLRHFVKRRMGGATGEFEVVVVVDGEGRDVAIAPFYLERNLGVAAFGHILQPFGRSNSFEPMTDEPIAVFRSGREKDSLEAIREYILGRGDRRWDVATLWIPAGGEKVGQLGVSRGTAGALGVVRVSDGPLVVSLPRSWAAFLAGLSKSMRDNLAYYPRKLSREVGPWSISVARTPEDVEIATRSLVELHRARSRATVGVPHRDHIPTEAQASFLRAWFRRAALRCQVTIITLAVGGEIIAAQAFLDGPAFFSVYYSGFDERFYKYSPLTIINAAMVRLAIERGLGRIEFPPALQPWKSRWNAREDKKLVEVSLYATRPASVVRGVARRLYFRLKYG
jgi:CelD/BcsL family acetyltransferase involved in cellulose biosynthesis